MQQIAAAAIHHTAACGGETPAKSMLDRMAKIGTCGKHASNAERDLHQILKNLQFKAPIECVNVRFVTPSTAEVKAVQFPCLFPDTFALEIWRMGEAYFRYFFLGNQDSSRLWQHVEQTAWGSQMLANARGDRSKLIPVTCYGDEIYTYKNSECGVVAVLAWSTDYLTAEHGPLERYFPIATYAQYLECEDTWADLSKEVADRFRSLVAKTDWPWCDKGYQFTFSSVTGDLKWVKEKFHLHDYNANQFCSYCNVVKRDPAGRIEHTISDFRPTAAHMQMRITHEDYIQSTAAEDRTLRATVNMLHVHPDRVKHFLLSACRSFG